jgi:hypothetical protein
MLNPEKARPERLSTATLSTGLRHTLLAATGCVGLALTPAAALAWEPGDDWVDSQCRTTSDVSGNPVEVCQGIYDGNKVYLGVYWNDDSEVVGPCSPEDPTPIEFKGMSKSDAKTWVKTYCP